MTTTLLPLTDAQPRLTVCMMCGCFMQIKARLPRAKCPAGRW